MGAEGGVVGAPMNEIDLSSSSGVTVDANLNGLGLVGVVALWSLYRRLFDEYVLEDNDEGIFPGAKSPPYPIIPSSSYSILEGRLWKCRLIHNGF